MYIYSEFKSLSTLIQNALFYGQIHGLEFVSSFNIIIIFFLLDGLTGPLFTEGTVMSAAHEYTWMFFFFFFLRLLSTFSPMQVLPGVKRYIITN